VSVSEGRELLIRQIADEICYPDGERPVWKDEAASLIQHGSVGHHIRQMLQALDRLGFVLIPASTLEADRRVLAAAEALTVTERRQVEAGCDPRCIGLDDCTITPSCRRLPGTVSDV
jgi:hypothetical protein